MCDQFKRVVSKMAVNKCGHFVTEPESVENLTFKVDFGMKLVRLSMENNLNMRTFVSQNHKVFFYKCG